VNQGEQRARGEAEGDVADHSAQWLSTGYEVNVGSAVPSSTITQAAAPTTRPADSGLMPRRASEWAMIP
jgi:hypothetical protein